MNSFSTSEDTKDYLRKSHAGEKKAVQSMPWQLRLRWLACVLHTSRPPHLPCTLRNHTIHSSPPTLAIPCFTIPPTLATPSLTTHTSHLPPADLLDEPDVELVQNMSCKVDAATMKPAEYPENPEMEW